MNVTNNSLLIFLVLFVIICIHIYSVKEYFKSSENSDEYINDELGRLYTSDGTRKCKKVTCAPGDIKQRDNIQCDEWCISPLESSNRNYNPPDYMKKQWKSSTNSSNSNLTGELHKTGHYCDPTIDPTTVNTLGVDGINTNNLCKRYSHHNALLQGNKIIIHDVTDLNGSDIIKPLDSNSLQITKKATKDYTNSSINIKCTKINSIDGPIQYCKGVCISDKNCDGITTQGNQCTLYSINNAKNSTKRSLIIKKLNIEYSISFWIHINSNNDGIIFQHGNQNDSYPKITFSSKSSEIKLWVKTYNNTDEVLSIPIGAYKKWLHILFTINGKLLVGYKNGQMQASHNMSEYAMWTLLSSPVRISPPWQPCNNMKISKLTWYPFFLTNELAENISNSSYPYNVFDPTHAFREVNRAPTTIKFVNEWREVNRVLDNWSPVKIIKEHGLVFFDGFIAGPKANIKIGEIPPSMRPKKSLVFPVGVKGGYLILVIDTNGDITIKEPCCSNNKIVNNNAIGYTPGALISLSNVRYSLNTTTHVIRVGGLIFLSGSVKFDTNGYAIAELDTPIAPPRSIVTFGIINFGSVMSLYRADAVKNQSENSLLYLTSDILKTDHFVTKITGKVNKSNTIINTYKFTTGDGNTQSYGNINEGKYFEYTCPKNTYMKKIELYNIHNTKSSTSKKCTSTLESTSPDTKACICKKSGKETPVNVWHNFKNKDDLCNRLCIDRPECRSDQDHANNVASEAPSNNKSSNKLTTLGGIGPIKCSDGSILNKITGRNSNNTIIEEDPPSDIRMPTSIVDRSSIVDSTHFLFDGIHWSVHNGMKLTLLSGFVYKKCFNPPTIYVDHGIVKLSGVIIKYYRKTKFIKCGINLKTPIGCFKEPTKNVNYHNHGSSSILECAHKGIKIGDTFAGLHNGGNCYTTNSYGRKGKSDECTMECKYDNKKLCGGPNDVNIYDISVEDELVAIIPKLYRPTYSMTFVCNSDNGVSSINILSNGEIRWTGTYGTTCKWFSLENICYLLEETTVDPKTGSTNTDGNGILINSSTSCKK